MNDRELNRKKTHSENEKISAAYALNLCTVSVSQIVDFNDVYILEQEYDAILNNLNLKKIPKDEALLNILRELLNTITFFRIQELKKEQIEKEYQQRMKTAIWSAIPSPSIFVSGNPVAIAMSLATTVGTGYMNYRKEKVKSAGEKEKAEMELQITAIEQLNSLRRELFTTAWRLADEYDFDDSLRLTEKQIEQYNRILMDQDEVRKYARLEAIQDKFEAYPPFWYFFGHTAHYIAETFQDETMKLEYREKAKMHFQHYEELNRFSILREDQMAASYALEYIELLLLEDEPDKQKINELLDLAVDKAGNANDILQLCAMVYLRIGNHNRAQKLLKILVNEEYNTVTNAQLLSAIYVHDRNHSAYALLGTRVSPRYLYPMPKGNEDIDYAFVSQQRRILKEKFKKTLQEIIDKYTSRINRDISVFDSSESYDSSYFDNSSQAKRYRIKKAREMFADDEKNRLYKERIHAVNLPLTYTNIFNEMYGKIFEADCYKDVELRANVVNSTLQKIEKQKGEINRIQDGIDKGSFEERDYENLQKIGLIGFVGESFECLYQTISVSIDEMDTNQLFNLESQLVNLCENMEVEIPEIPIDEGKYNDNSFGSDTELFNASMFGADAVVAKKDAEYMREMLSYIKDKMKNVSVNPKGLSVIYKDQIGFERYFSDGIFENYPGLKPHSLMVLRDNTKEKFDLIFTTEGIVHVLKGNVRKKAPYNEVRLRKDVLDLYGKKYTSEYMDVSVLYAIASGFDKRFINNLKSKTEFIQGVVSARELNSWFQSRKEAMMDSVTRVYAWPTPELLKGMGYDSGQELNKERFLLQFYYNSNGGDIMGLRVVEFEELDGKFREILNDAGGVLKIKS